MLTANYILSVYKPRPRIRFNRRRTLGNELLIRNAGIINECNIEANLTTERRFEIAEKWGVTKAVLNNIYSASKRIQQ